LTTQNSFMLATVKEGREHMAASSAGPIPNQNPEQDQQHERERAAAHLGSQMKVLHRYISSRVMGAMQEQLQDDDLSFSQMSALHQLRAYAPLSVGGLAERTGLSLPAASHLTDKLVMRGYAQRRENPDDRRAKLLDLSERGQQILEVMDRRFTDTYRAAFAQVSPQAVQAAASSIEALLQEMSLHPMSGGCLEAFPVGSALRSAEQAPEPANAAPSVSPAQSGKSAPPISRLSEKEQA
jgi:MarR family transcriptional regulator, organic hydroperoxide resistance regulator